MNQKMNPKKAFAIAMAVALFALGAEARAALCSAAPNPLVISTNCDTLLLSSPMTSVSIINGVKITESNFGIIPAVDISSSVGTFTNNGTIQTTLLLATGNEVSAVKTHAGSTVGTFNNTGTITAESQGHMALDVGGSIGVLNNSGALTGTGGATALYLTGGRITQLNNTGTISANNGALTLDNGAYIGTLSNAGLISSGSNGSNIWKDGIVVTSSASIGSIINSGTIDHSSTYTFPSQNITTYFGAINNQGVIGTITNTGTLTNGNGGATGFGIINSGTITTLNNQQSDLTLKGNLPANYNTIIVSPVNYGRLTVTAASGATTYGVSPGSVLATGPITYAAVLSGVTAANLTTTSGTYGGGLVSTAWTLKNSSGTTWDLVANQNIVASKPTVPNSAAASSLATQIVTTYASGAASGRQLDNGVNFNAAVQSLTSSQVDQLTSVHAEGYSSNMTIGLEQMKTVANTVMDRIHKPVSNNSSNSVSYELDAGRYVWADVAGFTGTVNSYNGLAGFGYNSYYGVVGVDLFRNETGGLGLYAGAGNSYMTQSSQVSQNFNNNTGYVGMYGGMYLASDVKLSGALGYSFGNSNASRYNPNVGSFTGGTASDSYSSNGAFAAIKLSHSMLVGEKFTLTPFIGGSYSQLNTGAVNETGGGDFNYTINAATSYQAITFAGAEFVQPLTSAGDNTLSAVGFYRFSYNWSANTDSAHTVTATSSAFGTFNQTGANMGPVSNLFGLGLQGQLSKDVSLRVGAVAAVNTNGTQFGGGGELRFRF